jgi:hypothetical protein
MKNIEIEIEDDLGQVINLDVSYTIDESEDETNTVGGVWVKSINAAWLNVVSPFIKADKDGKSIGEIIVNLDVERIDMEELRDTIQNEIEKRI